MIFPKAIVNEASNSGTPHLRICAGSDHSFPGSIQIDANNFLGVLYDCDDPEYLALAASSPVDACVQSRAKLAGGAETVIIYASNLDEWWVDANW